MGNTPATAFRLTPEDLAVLDALAEALSRKFGRQTRSDVLRIALRALAASEGVKVGTAKKKR